MSSFEVYLCLFFFLNPPLSFSHCSPFPCLTLSMARLLRTLQKSSSSLQTLINGLHLQHQKISTFLSQTRRRTYSSEIAKSPFESNMIRILNTEIEYQCEYAPLQQLASTYKSFTLQDRPGEQFVTLLGNCKEEDIKIEATMFDGCTAVQKPGDDGTEEDLRLHISLLVDISKGDESNPLQFVCSAWPDCLEIQKVYMLRRQKMPARPYLGPDFKALDGKIQTALRKFLEERGINDELSTFLHGYMMNKDRAELIGWLGNVMSFLEK